MKKTKNSKLAMVTTLSATAQHHKARHEHRLNRTEEMLLQSQTRWPISSPNILIS
ncbi:MAG: hypothetical protein JXR10_03265 [Cyclobacteriaceae bacterium]